MYRSRWVLRKDLSPEPRTQFVASGTQYDKIGGLETVPQQE